MKYKAPAYSELYKLRSEKFKSYSYTCCTWTEFDYAKFSDVLWTRRAGKRSHETYNECFIMWDTETSKKPDSDNNHVCAWSVAVRVCHVNVCTLYGQRPAELVDCLARIHGSMNGNRTLMHVHNLSYDWQFMRKFFFRAWGFPTRQLNTKSHYPINIEFENGIIFRDSLILAQRKLEKWADDMDVDHKKAVGKWDYNRIRNQHDILTESEIEYIEHDVLAGVECLDALAVQLNKKAMYMPFTATGIPREDVRKIGKSNRGYDKFKSAAPDYEQYNILSEGVFHGGFTHANRHMIGYVYNAECYDFASKYPACFLMYKFPTERFMQISNKTIEEILNGSDSTAYFFKLIMIHPRLKDPNFPMPALQFYKCIKKINAIIDNGRILEADYIEIWLTELDLKVIAEQYDYDAAYCVNVHGALKGYLPRWLTDYIYKLFYDKTMLKGGDPVAYALAKAKLNSVYGMMVQRCIQDDIIEDYLTGNYEPVEINRIEKYEDFLNKKNNVFLYFWGVWATAAAFYDIFQLGKCISGQWLYTDTDSCYATEWNKQALQQYNDNQKELLNANGYGPVIFKGREYWPGVAEFDGAYSQFCTMGAKRYACRIKAVADMLPIYGPPFRPDQLKITVAGVPKKTGAKCLNDNIYNFHKGLIFDGQTTGKLTHEYIYVDDIYIDKNGNETGDSVNLTPCDYLLDSCYTVKWENLEAEEITIQVYE